MPSGGARAFARLGGLRRCRRSGCGRRLAGALHELANARAQVKLALAVLLESGAIAVSFSTSSLPGELRAERPLPLAQREGRSVGELPLYPTAARKGRPTPGTLAAAQPAASWSEWKTFVTSTCSVDAVAPDRESVHVPRGAPRRVGPVRRVLRVVARALEAVIVRQPLHRRVLVRARQRHGGDPCRSRAR